MLELARLALRTRRGRHVAAGAALGLALRVPRRRRLTGKVVRVTLTASVAAVAIPAVVFTPPPAAALTSCPNGLGTAMRAGLVLPICVDLDGNVKGILNSAGAFTTTIPPQYSTPSQVSMPSSVLAAENDPAASTIQNANRAAINGAPANGGRMAFAKGLLGKGLSVVSAAATGYMIGQQIASAGCSFGVSYLCYPPKDSSVPVNTDVVVTGDSGLLVTQLPANLFYAGSPALGISLSGGASTSTWNMKTANTSDPMIVVVEKPGSTGKYTMNFMETTSNSTYGTRGLQSGDTTRCYTYGSGWQGSSYYGDVDSSGRQAVPSGENFTKNACADGLGRLYVGLASGNGSAVTQWLAIYAYPGDAQRPAPQSSNPQRRLYAQNDCIKSDGSTVSTNALSDPFYETDSQFPTYPVAPSCPAGTVLGGSKVVETSPNLPDKKVFTFTNPDPVKQWQQKYPQCADGTCRLSLYRVAGTKTGNCFSDVGMCEGWFEDPNKSSNYECRYGKPANQDAVALSECNVYSPTFDPVAKGTGATYGDPKDGKKPQTVRDPVTDPDPDPDPTSDPGSAGNPLPGQDGASCYPTGWAAFNPLEWVYKPVQCVLTWAFVPDSATVTSIKTDLSTRLGDSGWAQWVSSLGGLFGKLGGSGNGCDGPEFNFNWGPAHIVGHPLSACKAPLSFAALMTRSLVALLVVVYGGLACIRALGSGFGFQVHMGRSTADAT